MKPEIILCIALVLSGGLVIDVPRPVTQETIPENQPKP
jgi:hypothetical protein